jgi:hypothetical protein
MEAPACNNLAQEKVKHSKNRPMKKTLVITAFTMLILYIPATPASAQNKNDSSAVEKQKQLIELSKTNGNHQLLLHLAGNWSFTGAHFSPDSGTKTVEVKGTITRKAIMDGRYFICETTGGKIKMPWSDGKEVNYRDLYVEGYDNDKKKFFRAAVANHWTTGISIMEGSYDSTTKTFAYELEMQNRKFLDHIKILDTDHYLFIRYLKKGDQKIKVTESAYTRAGK